MGLGLLKRVTAVVRITPPLNVPLEHPTFQPATVVATTPRVCSPRTTVRAGGGGGQAVVPTVRTYTDIVYGSLPNVTTRQITTAALPVANMAVESRERPAPPHVHYCSTSVRPLEWAFRSYRVVRPRSGSARSGATWFVGKGGESARPRVAFAIHQTVCRSLPRFV